MRTKEEQIRDDNEQMEWLKVHRERKLAKKMMKLEKKLIPLANELFGAPMYITYREENKDDIN